MPVITTDGRTLLRVGPVTHRFRPISCVGIKVKGSGFKQGDELYFEKLATTKDGKDFKSTQVITSIQVEHREVEKALPGQEVAVKLNVLPPNGTKVFVFKNPTAAPPA